jgi:hypothetical protein
MALLVAACASHGPSPKATPAPRPEPLTVPDLRKMLEQGETVGTILGRIDSSGTVYRLTTQQRAGLRAAGMPAAILGKMEITYQHAITVNPDLAKSDDRWIRRGDYWYGGLPAGWPREWVVGAPAPGRVFR